MRRGKLRTVLLLIALCAGIVVTTAAWFFMRHREVRDVSASAARVEFEQLRARFAGEPALLDGQLRPTATDLKPSRVPGPLRTFHTVIFDTRGGERLVKMTVPYWLGRRYARHDGNFVWLGELTFLDDTEFDPERIELSLAQIERRGPGLLVDYQHPGGGQFIAWVE